MFSILQILGKIKVHSDPEKLENYKEFEKQLLKKSLEIEKINGSQLKKRNDYKNHAFRIIAACTPQNPVECRESLKLMREKVEFLVDFFLRQFHNVSESLECVTLLVRICI